MIDLTIKMMNGHSHAVSIAPTASLSELRTSIHAITQVPADKQRLIYSGRVLNDENSSMHQLGLSHGKVLHLVIRQSNSVQNDVPQPAPPAVNNMLVGAISIEFQMSPSTGHPEELLASAWQTLNQVENILNIQADGDHTLPELTRRLNIARQTFYSQWIEPLSLQIRNGTERSSLSLVEFRRIGESMMTLTEAEIRILERWSTSSPTQSTSTTHPSATETTENIVSGDGLVADFVSRILPGNLFGSAAERISSRIFGVGNTSDRVPVVVMNHLQSNRNRENVVSSNAEQPSVEAEVPNTVNEIESNNANNDPGDSSETHSIAVHPLMSAALSTLAPTTSIFDILMETPVVIPDFMTPLLQNITPSQLLSFLSDTPSALHSLHSIFRDIFTNGSLPFDFPPAQIESLRTLCFNHESDTQFSVSLHAWIRDLIQDVEDWPNIVQSLRPILDQLVQLAALKLWPPISLKRDREDEDDLEHKRLK